MPIWKNRNNRIRILLVSSTKQSVTGGQGSGVANFPIQSACVIYIVDGRTSETISGCTVFSKLDLNETNRTRVGVEVPQVSGSIVVKKLN